MIAMPCALCAADTPLLPHDVPGGPYPATTDICQICVDQITTLKDANHWRCLASSMWSEDPATQVLCARILTRLSDHDWARDLSDQLYLSDDLRGWAENLAPVSDHKDSNGVLLTQGDNVVLTKDLPVKGAGFTAKRGTAVRGISLVADNPAHIEGRVNGQRIVILTEFVKLLRS